MVVAGWLKANPQPLDTALGQEVMRVETFTDDYGKPVYYIVYLEPSGFVIVSADDLIEPIIGFADDGTYDPSLENPLGALVTNDLNGRMAAVQRTFRLQAIVGDAPFSDTQKKWSFFISLAETSEGGFSLMGRNSIPDVRVAPLVQSKWGQTDACGSDCYNYYTPNNYPSGCVATAMAQLMRYYKHPTTGIGVHQFTIQVDDVEQTAFTRGGDGNGGAYRWDLMVLEPGCSTTLEQREAIGALCYDAGVTVRTEYSSDGSKGYGGWAATIALCYTFKYENAVFGWDWNNNIGLERVNSMVNPNLDAGHPVILGLRREGADGRHAVLADGYGYNSSTLYHHLNMGWSGSDDAWYNLPTIDSPRSYNVVDGCIYNIFTSGSGEIISGRVTDRSGYPIRNATVTALIRGGPDTYTAVTNNKGIYALVGVISGMNYTVTATKPGCNFTPQHVITGTSRDHNSVSGNRWGVNFVGDDIPSPSLNESLEDFETGDFRKFPWEHEGDSHWTTTSWEKHSGNHSAQAGTIDDYGSTTLRVTLDCIAGDITFYCKIYSEGGCDYLTFYIDGVEKDTWSGDEDWAKVSFPVAAGTRTFEWTYSKDYSVAEGDDTVWIDDIAFPVQVQEPPTPTPPPPPTSNLVAWWKLDEGSGTIAADWSGNGHDGTAQATPEWVDGLSGYGKALYFDGSDPAPAWVNCGTWNPSAGTGQLTAALWVRWDGPVEDVWQGVIAKRDGGGSQGTRMMWDIFIHKDKHSIQFSRAGSYPPCGNRVLPIGQWSHVAATFNGTTLIFYIDCEETGRGDFSFGTKTDSTIIIGALSLNGGNGFHGALDDIRLYNNALSPAEIKSLAIPPPMVSDPFVASKPSPADGALLVNTQVSLSWSPGDFAVSHDVYFGENFDDVNNGTPDTFRGNQTGIVFAVGFARSIYPNGLVPGTTYYWRIDEVEADGTTAYKGNVWSFTVWSFTTANFLVVDDFEDYDAGDNHIWYTWKDGLGYAAHPTLPPYPGNGTGSMVGDENTGSYTEETIVHGGNQSMPLFYDNNKQGYFKYSEAELTLTYPRDLTAEGVRVLSLWFCGDASNAAERMYVALNGSAVVYHDNPDAALIEDWTEWTIDLQEFAAQGVNLANVNTIAIGFGDRNNPVAGGSGTVYFDDIRLYQPPAP